MSKHAPTQDEALQCPRCATQMQKQRHVRAEIDHCEKCRGSFFDEGEMLAVLGRAADPEVWARSNRKRTPSTSEMSCPRCHKRMHTHPLAQDEIDVDVDFCLSCGGIWLDGGELNAVMQIGVKQLAEDEASARKEKTQAKNKTKGQSKPSAPPDTATGLISRYLAMFPKT